MFKENRTMTVYGISTQPGYKIVPQIRLQGEWLKELGYNIGDKLNVECREGQLIIKKK